MTTRLLPYQKDRPCLRCGQKGAETRYVGKAEYYRRYYDWCETLPAHLHRRCPNCHYEWCEELAVSPVNSEGLTPEQVALDG